MKKPRNVFKKGCAWVLTSALLLSTVSTSSSVSVYADEDTELCSETVIVTEEDTEVSTMEEEVTSKLEEVTSEVTESTEVVKEVSEEISSTEVPEELLNDPTTEKITSEETSKEEKVDDVSSKETDTKEQECGKMYISLTEGGSVVVTLVDGSKKTLERNGNKVTLASSQGIADVTSKLVNGKYLVSEEKIGDVIGIEVKPKSNYNIATYKVLKDGGEVEKSISDFSSNVFNDTVTVGNKTIKVEFSEKENSNTVGDDTKSDEEVIEEDDTLYLSVNYGGTLSVKSSDGIYNYYLNKEGNFILESPSGTEVVTDKVVNGGYALKVKGTVEITLEKNEDGVLSSLSTYDKDFNNVSYKKFDSESNYTTTVNVEATPYIMASFLQVINEDDLVKEDDNKIYATLFAISKQKRMETAEKKLKKDPSLTSYTYGSETSKNYGKKYGKGSFVFTSGHIGDGKTASGKFTDGVLKDITATGLTCWMHTAAGYDAPGDCDFTYNVVVRHMPSMDLLSTGETYEVTVNIFAYDESKQGGFNGTDSSGRYYMYQSSGLVYRYSDSAEPGYCRVMKTSTKSEFETFSNYSLNGAEFSVYNNKKCGDKDLVDTLAINPAETNARFGLGISTTSKGLEPGTYYIKETKAPEKGYLIDSGVHEVEVTAGNVQEVCIQDPPIVNDPQFKLYKYYQNTKIPISGATYKISWYDHDVNDSNYKDKIISMNSGGGENNFFPGHGMGNTPSDTINAQSNMKTATYVSDSNGLVDVRNSKPKTNNGFPTNANGTIQIPIGWISLQEETAPKGFVKDENVYVAKIVQSGNTAVIQWLNLSKTQQSGGGVSMPATDELRHDEAPITGTVSIQKIDAETGLPNPIKGGTFEGIKWNIINMGDTIRYGSDSHEVGKGKVVTTLTLNSSGFAEIPKTAESYTKLPAGSYRIQEASGNLFYKVNKDDYIDFTISSEGQREDFEMRVGNYPNRGEIELVKTEKWVDSKGNVILDERRFANIPFKITNTSTGEYRIIVTDDEGYWSSVTYKNDFNSKDEIESMSYASITKSTLGSPAGVYFGLDVDGNSYTPDATKGSFPVGTYTIEELKCRANCHTDLVSSTFTVEEDSTTPIDLGTFVDVHEVLGISTVALDSKTQSHVSITGTEVTVVDTVSMSGLPLDNEWHVKGVLMDVTDLNNVVPLTINGEIITAESEKFVSDVSDKEVTTSFTFDSTGLDGKLVCVYEYLYNDTEIEKGTTPNDGDLFLYAKEDNPNNISQIVRFPELDTSAYDYHTKDKVGISVPLEDVLKDLDDSNSPDESKGSSEETTNSDNTSTDSKDSTSTTTSDTLKVSIEDKVDYANLDVGLDYTVKGELVNKSTEKVVATAETSFNATTTAGTLTMNFEFDEEIKTLQNGVKYVVYEYIYLGDVCVVAHNDLEDKEQTVSYSSLHTTARDELSNTSTGTIGEKVTIIDTVSYSGLLVDKEYTIKGKLMNKETGKPLVIDNKEITSEVTFVATEDSGTVDLTYSLDSSNLKGETVVVFEDLYYNDIKVATHSDIEDSDQTIHYPEIGTQAKDSNTNDSVGTVGKTTIVDTVTYKNLVVGQQYIVSGTLMDKATGEYFGKDLGKEPITSSKTFIPETSDGSIDISFSLDASELKNKTVVVFEDLLINKKEVTTHSDINDEGQTIVFPEIGTTATFEDGSKEALAEDSCTIVDKVSYTNLIVGKQYTISGKLMSKKTSEPVLIDNKEVTSSVTFTAETSSGSVDLVYEISDASVLKGETVVVFEDLYHNGVLVTSHSDITDEGQTVSFPEIGTQAEDKKTGEKEMTVGKRVTLVDTVKYKGLTPGVKYTLKGVVVDKKTEKEVATATAKFTPDSSEGETTVEFKLNTKELMGKELVVFESLYNVDGKLVAEHKDIDDEGQTVSVPEEMPKTSDNIAWMFGIGALLILVGGAVLIIEYRRKKLS